MCDHFNDQCLELHLGSIFLLVMVAAFKLQYWGHRQLSPMQ